MDTTRLVLGLQTSSLWIQTCQEKSSAAIMHEGYSGARESGFKSPAMPHTVWPQASHLTSLGPSFPWWGVGTYVNSVFVVAVVQSLSCIQLFATPCSLPGFPVLPYLLEFAQIHVHWVSDAIQPSHPLLPPSPFAFNLSQHHTQKALLLSLVLGPCSLVLSCYELRVVKKKKAKP